MPKPTAPTTTALPPLLVTAEQAARMLGVCRTTVYYLTRDGELTPVRIGRATRYAISDLEAYVNRSVAGNQVA
jgi:excisionase family DNA binding protein